MGSLSLLICGILAELSADSLLLVELSSWLLEQAFCDSVLMSFSTGDLFRWKLSSISLGLDFSHQLTVLHVGCFMLSLQSATHFKERPSEKKKDLPKKSANGSLPPKNSLKTSSGLRNVKLELPKLS